MGKEKTPSRKEYITSSGRHGVAGVGGVYINLGYINTWIAEDPSHFGLI